MSTLVITESEASFKHNELSKGSHLVLWSSFANGVDKVSIPSIVEEDSEQLRKEYLLWLRHLENVKIKGRTLNQLTDIYPGLSLWQLSTIKEKSLWKTPEIYSAVRILAFKNYYKTIANNDFKKVIIKLNDKTSSKILRQWLEKKDNNVEEKNANTNLSLKRLYLFLPEIFKGLIYLLQYKSKSILLGIPNKIVTKEQSGTISFFSYFLSTKLDQSNEFISKYWGSLDTSLTERQNWFHIFNKSVEAPNLTSARKTLRSIDTQANHSLFEDYQSRKVIIKAFFKYLRFYFSFLFFPNFSSINDKAKIEIDISPLFIRHWNDSIYGKTSLNNFIITENIRHLVRQLPPQKFGFYLLENQAWEKILNYFWNTSNQGPLFGAQHNAVCFWDLRHTYLDNYPGKNKLILPTKILLNGQNSYDSYVKSGWPEQLLEKVEALRYQYINRYSDKTAHQKNEFSKMLFLGDYSNDINISLARFCRKVIYRIGPSFDITFKAHPASDIDFKELVNDKIKITHDSLEILASKFDMVIASNPTTAAIELLTLGCKVFIHIDGKFFNLSPLKGYNASFISEENIDEIFSTNFKIPPVQDYFYLNKDLTKWKALVNPFTSNE